MSEDKKTPPVNFWNKYEFPEGQKLEYASTHFVQSNGREIVMVLGNFNPPNTKPTSVCKVIMNPMHAQELVINLQNQINQIKNQGQNPDDNSSKRS